MRTTSFIVLVFAVTSAAHVSAQVPASEHPTPGIETDLPSDIVGDPETLPAPASQVTETPPAPAPEPPAPAAPASSPNADSPASPSTNAAHPDVPEQVEPPVPPPQLKIEIGNGTSIRFGMLSQLQYEARGNVANDDLSHNLFVRRFALLLGATVLHEFEIFLDLHVSDLFKAGADGLKSGPGITTKDAFATYKGLGDVLKIDGGLMLPPYSHNALQSSFTLYSWDTFFNDFRHSTVFGSTSNPYGRDLGVQLRGLLFGGVLEYRAGVFQGKRDAAEVGPPARPSSRNPPRAAGRLQINLLDPETGYFYAGTYLGAKRILSFGGSYDFQPFDGGSYRSWAVDGMTELPLGPGGVTAQVNLVYRNGGAFLELPRQTALMGEAGYRIDAILLSPIVRFERRWARDSALDETDLSGGLAFWAYGHKSNLKAFYTRVEQGNSGQGFDQLNAQWQVAFY